MTAAAAPAAGGPGDPAEVLTAGGLHNAAAIVAGAERGSLNPARAGLAVDVSGTVREACGGRSWDPRRMWDYFLGGDNVDPVVTVDEAAFATVGPWVEAIATAEGLDAHAASIRVRREGSMGELS